MTCMLTKLVRRWTALVVVGGLAFVLAVAPKSSSGLGWMYGTRTELQVEVMPQEVELLIAPGKAHDQKPVVGLIVLGETFKAQRLRWSEYHKCRVESARLQDVSVDELVMKDCRFEDTVFQFSSYVHIKLIDQCRIRDCTVQELSLTGGQIVDLQIDNCYIVDLELSNMTVRDMEFRNCTIEHLRLVNCRVENLLLLGCGIGELQLIECDTDGIDLHGSYHAPDLVRRNGDNKYGGRTQGTVGVEVRRGRLDNLDVRKMQIEGASVLLYEVQMEAPVFSAELVTDLDIRRLLWPPEGLIIGQEIEAEEGVLSQKLSKELLREARGVYTVLQRRYADAGMGREERFMAYRLGVVNSKLSNSKAKVVIDYLWNDLCRGRYGTNPWVVVRTACLVCMIFACVFFFLGWMHIAWGLVVPESVTGQAGEGGVAYFIRGILREHVFQYYWICLTFSLNQLLFGATRMFDIMNPTKMFTLSPSRYKSIGIGQLISGLESLIGLVLLFNFIRAFVRTL